MLSMAQPPSERLPITGRSLTSCRDGSATRLASMGRSSFEPEARGSTTYGYSGAYAAGAARNHSDG